VPKTSVLAEGRQPIELTPTRLLRLSKDLPHDWSEQRHVLDFGCRQPSDTIEYEDISREAWRLAAIRMEPHLNTLWRASVFPRSNVDPERIKKLLDYDSIIVNSREFEKLWPRVDKTVGANPEHIEKLRKGRMATWP
jgi:hypothetical protein